MNTPSGSDKAELQQPPTYTETFLSQQPTPTQPTPTQSTSIPIDQKFKAIVESPSLWIDLNAKRLPQPTTDRSLPPNIITIKDFWHPIVNFFAFEVSNPKLTNMPQCFAHLMINLLLLPRLFFTWLLMNIATMIRLTPGDTPHSSQVPEWLLIDIYNDQIELNHLLITSKQMVENAEKDGNLYPSSTTTTTPSSTTTTTTTTVPSHTKELIKINPKSVGVTMPEYLNELLTFSDATVTLDTIFVPFDNVAAFIPNNQLGDKYHNEAIIGLEHLKPVEKAGQKQLVTLRDIYKPITRSLPYHSKTNELTVHEPILPQDVLRMWKDDEQRYYTWLVIIFEMLLAIIYFFAPQLGMMDMVICSLCISIIPTIILAAQYITRCDAVHHAFRLTIDMILSFPIAMMILFMAGQFLLEFIDSSIFIRLLAIILGTARIMKCTKPSRHEDYEHHVLIVQNYLQQQQQSTKKD